VPADISVVIPAHNEGPRLGGTIASIAETRSTRAHVEIVIADDQSDDGTEEHLRAAWPQLSDHPRLDIVVTRTPERSGVPRSRNHAAARATADILFITDAHVRFPQGWDALVFKHLRSDRILAGAVGEASSAFVGYGCRLVVPFMGTYWNRDAPAQPVQVQIAACPATALSRELFEKLGGYDHGMVMYGAAEPEFSVRAWLSGAEIVVVPQLLVQHVFKPQEERAAFIREVRPHMVCNGLRFGLLYASEEGALQLLRYYALKFPNLFQQAFATVERSDVWARRAQLERELKRPFSWFVDHFQLEDQAGGEIR
jgi:glycosyltransferase involved in cell wall biosynthesis